MESFLFDSICKQSEYQLSPAFTTISQEEQDDYKLKRTRNVEEEEKRRRSR